MPRWTYKWTGDYGMGFRLRGMYGTSGEIFARWPFNFGPFTWHTWDERGIGGENASDPTLEQAADEVEKAMVRQGWLPQKNRVADRKAITDAAKGLK